MHTCLLTLTSEWAGGEWLLVVPNMGENFPVKSTKLSKINGKVS